VPGESRLGRTTLELAFGVVEDAVDRLQRASSLAMK
jgi:hypothetical protein